MRLENCNAVNSSANIIKEMILTAYCRYIVLPDGKCEY